MPIVAAIHIEMDDAGNVQVSGAIDNKLIALGLLGVAADTITDRLRKAESRVQLAPPGLHLVAPGQG